MIILVGASASGKTELAKILYKKYGYNKCVTTTTRAPRKNEKNHLDYHFLTEKEFLALKKEHKFLEVSIYDHHYYGLQKNDVCEKGVVVVDPNGANSIVKNSEKNIFVVLVHSKRETRMNRMINRGDSLEKSQRRIKNDEKIFNVKHFAKIDLLLENEDKDLNILASTIHEAYMHGK